MRVLVTGAGGYLGSALAERFLADGHEVRAMEAAERGLDVLDRFDHPGLQALEGDVTDEEDLAEACRGVDAAFHMAGISSVEACRERPREALEVNGYAVRTLLEALEDPELVVYPSSVAGMYTLPKGAVYKHRSKGGDVAYTRPSRGTVTEEDPVVPVNDYGVSKFLGETYARAYEELHGSPTLIFRQSNVYGPSPAGPGRGVVPVFVERALRGEPLTVHGSGEQARDFLHVDDLVDAYAAALRRRPAGELLNLARGRSTTIQELAERVADLVTGTEIEHVESDRDELEIKRYEVSNDRARRVLDWAPDTDLEEGLGEMKKYMEERT